MGACSLLPARLRMGLPIVLTALVLLTTGPGRASAQAPPGNRILAPELDGGRGWIGTKKNIHLKDLRGKIVIFDFWTLC